ncbi:hypothetical protein O6P43_033202 [Quillaja saponaria]|uniref:Uncharacterized protein n=1 Tax=Quillaja saponaria TaxID=32244 RepID=A0AAD7KQ14_QUISA|nr:hypothetical protein O6P43_033202 [Quillaja saponaria]
MVGSLAIILSNAKMSSTTAIRDQSEIFFSRFFNYSSVSSTCSEIVVLKALGSLISMLLLLFVLISVLALSFCGSQ